MKFCRYCGKELNDEAVFCPSCGCATEGGNTTEVKKSESLSPLSIIGFVFAFVESLVGLICSIIAYKTAVREGDNKSKNFSNAGIVISAVFLGIQVLAVILVTVLVIAVLNEPDYPPYYYY